MKNRNYLSKASVTAMLAGIALVGLGTLSAQAAPAKRAAKAIWVDNTIYNTVLTDTAFKSPPPQSTDIIYNFDNSGLSGQRAVADAAPGDRGYNGGRWVVKAAVFTPLGLAMLDMDGNNAIDNELTSEQDVLDAVDAGLLVIHDTGKYFECPVIPSGGRQP